MTRDHFPAPELSVNMVSRTTENGAGMTGPVYEIAWSNAS